MAKHKKQRKPILPARGREPRQTADASPEAMALGRQLAGMTPERWATRLERNLLGAIALRNEPEFADFYFDPEPVIEVTARHLQRYRPRLDALVAKGDQDAGRQLYDEMRIEIIAELVTPEIRRDLQARGQRCMDRLKRGRNADKMEMALYVHTLLSGGDQTLPLGLCGLFMAIYQDSLKRAMELHRSEEALRDAILDKLPQLDKAEPEQLLALAKQPEVVAQVTQTLAAHPELRARLERDVDRMLVEVGEAIRRGEVKVSFFTDEEILITYADAYNVMGDVFEGKKAPDSQAIVARFFELMQRNLVEQITPERNRQFCQYLEALGKEMTRSGDRKRQKLGVQFALAARTVETWEPGKHPLLYEVYVAQAKQMQEHGLTHGSSPEREALFRRLIAERQMR